MFHKLKSKIKYILLIALLITLSSCGTASFSPDSIDHANGVAFEYYTSYNEQIDIHLPTNIYNCLACEYKNGSERTNKSLWTINYEYVNKYLTKYNNDPYEIINSIKPYLEEQISFEFNLYKNNEIIEMEYTLKNQTLEEIGYIIAEIYLPVLIVDNDYTFIVSVPIKSIALVKTDKYVISINDSNILLEDFYSNPNLILK